MTPHYGTCDRCRRGYEAARGIGLPSVYRARERALGTYRVIRPNGPTITTERLCAEHVASMTEYGYRLEVSQ